MATKLKPVDAARKRLEHKLKDVKDQVQDLHITISQIVAQAVSSAETLLLEQSKREFLERYSTICSQLESCWSRLMIVSDSLHSVQKGDAIFEEPASPSNDTFDPRRTSKSLSLHGKRRMDVLAGAATTNPKLNLASVKSEGATCSSPTGSSKRIKTCHAADEQHVDSGLCSSGSSYECTSAVCTATSIHAPAPSLTSAFARCVTSMHASVAGSRQGVSRIVTPSLSGADCCSCARSLKALQETHTALKQSHEQLLYRTKNNAMEVPPDPDDPVVMYMKSWVKYHIRKNGLEEDEDISSGVGIKDPASMSHVLMSLLHANSNLQAQVASLAATVEASVSSLMTGNKHLNGSMAAISSKFDELVQNRGSPRATPCPRLPKTFMSEGSYVNEPVVSENSGFADVIKVEDQVVRTPADSPSASTCATSDDVQRDLRPEDDVYSRCASPRTSRRYRIPAHCSPTDTHVAKHLVELPLLMPAVLEKVRHLPSEQQALVENAFFQKEERHTLALTLVGALFSQEELGTARYDGSVHEQLDCDRLSLVRELCFMRFPVAQGKDKHKIWSGFIMSRIKAKCANMRSKLRQRAIAEAYSDSRRVDGSHGGSYSALNYGASQMRAGRGLRVAEADLGRYGTDDSPTPSMIL